MDIVFYTEKNFHTGELETVEVVKPIAGSDPVNTGADKPEYPLHNRCKTLEATMETEMARLLALSWHSNGVIRG